MTSNSSDTSEVVLTLNFIARNVPIRKERSHINHLSYHIKKLFKNAI